MLWTIGITVLLTVIIYPNAGYLLGVFLYTPGIKARTSTWHPQYFGRLLQEAFIDSGPSVVGDRLIDGATAQWGPVFETEESYRTKMTRFGPLFAVFAFVVFPVCKIFWEFILGPICAFLAASWTFVWAQRSLLWAPARFIAGRFNRA